METILSSQQSTRWEGHELSGNSLDSLAFEQNYRTLIYDISGALLHTAEGNDIILKKEEMIVWPCDACQKNFASKQSLERHLNRFPLCKLWIKDDEHILTESVYIWAQGKIDEALSHEDNCKKCRFCQIEFVSIGNFHKHFKSSTVCNSLGMREVKKAFN